VKDFLSEPKAPDQVWRSRALVHSTIDFMFADRNVFATFLNTISRESHIYTHSVHVLAYSVALAQRAGLSDRATLREVANGALLIDVGMALVPVAILTKKAALTPDDWAEIKRHPIYGDKILREDGGLGEIALDIVRHHHERMTGAGYPDGIGGPDLSPFVRIAGICDVFDSLTTDRPQRKALSSFAAIRLMAEDMSEELDPELLRAFIDLMGNPEDPSTPSKR
jgi:cyclic di-GMP phosphodiesterase